LFRLRNGALCFRYSIFEQSLEVLCSFRWLHPDDLSAARVLSYKTSGCGVGETAAGKPLFRRIVMAQKVIKIVGTSKESFAKAAANAVAEAAKTVRNLKWARVCGLEMELDGKNITQYGTTTNIYFDIEE
jgi:dodecin